MTVKLTTVGRLTVYADASDNTLRIGSKGKKASAETVLRNLPKGQRRQVRKAAYANHLTKIAAAK